MNNPFNLTYGKMPLNIIDRDDESRQIIDMFSREMPSNYSYIITGVRGSGKTVLLREISSYFRKEGWIVVDINPQNDNIILSLAQKMFYEGNNLKLFLNWKLTFDLKYIQLEISKNDYINDPEIIFEQLLDKAVEHNKKVLITIDEVNNTQALKVFANYYQSLIGKNKDVFLLMTGLRDNVDALLNSKAASFLSRTPKLDLKPLDIISISIKYKEILSISDELSIKLAKLTNGYAFAFQVLGYLFFESKDKTITEKLISDYDQYLRTNGYDVIWKNLSSKEKCLCKALAKNMDDKSINVLEFAHMQKSNYQNYRNRLIEQGIIVSTGYNQLSFTLPRFKLFVLLMAKFEEE